MGDKQQQAGGKVQVTAGLLERKGAEAERAEAARAAWAAQHTQHVVRGRRSTRSMPPRLLLRSKGGRLPVLWTALPAVTLFLTFNS